MANHKAYPYLLQHLVSLKKEVRSRIFLKNSFDVRKSFDYNSFDGSDIYEPVVYRSTKKENFTESHEDSIDPILQMCDSIDAILPKDEDGKFTMSPDDFGQKLSTEFKNMDDDLFLLFRDLTYFYEPHEYTSLAIELEPLNAPKGNSFQSDERIENISERLLKIQNEPLGVGSFKNDVSEDDKGYIIPEYNLLRWNIDHLSIEKEYEKISKQFDTKEKTAIIGAVSIGNYRDLLAKQLDRQIEQLADINDTLLDFLDIFYVSVEKTLREVFLSDEVNDDSEIPKHISATIDDWLYIIGMMREIFDTFILNNNDEEILKYHEKTISEIPFVHKQVKDDFINQMYHIGAKKKPILEVARKLALKATICESLLEDLLTSEPFKTFEEFDLFLRSKEISDYGRHGKNKDWIKKTYKTQKDLQPSPNQAVDETAFLYEEKFRISIHPSTIRRFCGLVQ